MSKLETYELLKIQNEYSKFVTMREFVDLSSSDDYEYCINILECIPNVNFENATKEIKELMEWDEEYECFSGSDWDYIMLDEILMKYVGRELYRDY